MRVERYHATVVWEPDQTGKWSLGAIDDGTQFHLFCAAHVQHESQCVGPRYCRRNHVDHETKVWGKDLSPKFQAVLYPGP